MPYSDWQFPNSGTALQPRPLDITYRLIHQCSPGEAPRDCSNSYNYIRFVPDTQSELGQRIHHFLPDPQFIMCYIPFAWANYSGAMTGAYDIVKEDTLVYARPIHERSRKNPADRDIEVLDITLIKECTQDGTLVDNGGRYVRLDIKFVGSPARSATIWGKCVSGEAYLGARQFSMEEKLRLGIEYPGKYWTWDPDLCKVHIRFLP